MAVEIKEVEAKPTLSTTDLAFERTALAYERTLMAWIRTAMSLISFGFTIYKFFQEWRKTEQPVQSLFTPRIVGMIMILFGFVGLLFASIQHHAAIKKLKKDYPYVQRSLSSVLAILILMFGLALFFAALFRQ
jgi:inner membrane protein YidH